MVNGELPRSHVGKGKGNEIGQANWDYVNITEIGKAGNEARSSAEKENVGEYSVKADISVLVN